MAPRGEREAESLQFILKILIQTKRGLKKPIL